MATLLTRWRVGGVKELRFAAGADALWARAFTAEFGDGGDATQPPRGASSWKVRELPACPHPSHLCLRRGVLPVPVSDG